MSESIITKRALSQALKDLCGEKPFDKISISDITAACGLNRQTFYYHFQDKYELLNWIYYNENFARITEDICFENWDEKILQMLRIMQKDKRFYTNTLKERQHTFESYLFDMAKELFTEAIGLFDELKQLDDQEKEFDAEFYAYGICGMILSWVENGMKIPPQTVARRLKELARARERIVLTPDRETDHGLYADGGS